MTTTPRGPRLGQLRSDSAVRQAISSAIDTALAQRPDLAADARRARHWAVFETVWANLGYPNDPALKRRTFAQVLPRLEAEEPRNEARRALAASLAVDDHRRRIEAARRLGAAQGRALALREHRQALAARQAAETRALIASLDAAARRARKRRPAPQLRTWLWGARFTH